MSRHFDIRFCKRLSLNSQECGSTAFCNGGKSEAQGPVDDLFQRCLKKDDDKVSGTKRPGSMIDEQGWQRREN
jgi:hypothetical protein